MLIFCQKLVNLANLTDSAGGLTAILSAKSVKSAKLPNLAANLAAGAVKVCLLLVLLFPMLSYAQNNQGVIRTDIQQATQYVAEKNWRELEKFSAQWRQRDNKNWQSWYHSALALHHLEKNDEALTAIRNAATLTQGKELSVQELKITIQTQLQDWLSVEKELRQLIKTNDKNPQYWQQLLEAVTLQMTVAETHNKTTYSNAADIYKNVLRFNDHVNNVGYWREYIALLTQLGDDATRRTASARLIKLEPKDIKTLEWMFEYDKQNSDPQVLENTRYLLQKAAPKHPYLFIELARRARADRDYDNARYYYEILAQAKEHSLIVSEALVALGEITAFEEKSVDASLSFYLKAIKNDPRYLPAWEKTVVYYRNTRQTALAEQFFSKMLAIERKTAAGKPITRDILDGLKL